MTTTTATQINNVTFAPKADGVVTITLANLSWDAPIAQARKFYQAQQQALSNPLQDGEIVEEGMDACPQHNTPMHGEYTFGLMDSTVWTYKGCKCATCCVEGTLTYRTSYEKAASQARLRKAMNAAR